MCTGNLLSPVAENGMRQRRPRARQAKRGRSASYAARGEAGHNISLEEEEEHDRRCRGQRKSFQTATRLKIETTAMIGREMGSTIFHRIISRDAPSTEAASM